jgi:hypothetical protein
MSYLLLEILQIYLSNIRLRSVLNPFYHDVPAENSQKRNGRSHFFLLSRTLPHRPSKYFSTGGRDAWSLDTIFGYALYFSSLTGKRRR